MSRSLKVQCQLRFCNFSCVSLAIWDGSRRPTLFRVHVMASVVTSDTAEFLTHARLVCIFHAIPHRNTKPEIRLNSILTIIPGTVFPPLSRVIRHLDNRSQGLLTYPATRDAVCRTIQETLYRYPTIEKALAILRDIPCKESPA